MEDEVICEIDVFLSKNLAENLFLFQFPVRPNSMTYEDVTVLEARAKPKQQKVELEMALNVNSSSYDRGKGEQFVVNVNSCNKMEDSYFQGTLMDKQTLISTRTVNSTARYAIGVIRNGGFHICPLQGMLQLRPSFSYLDLGDPKNRPGGDADDSMGADLEPEEEEAKPVTVKFTRRETDRAKLIRERSYGFLQKKMSEEAWVKLQYNPIGSETSRLEMNRMECSQQDERAPELHVSAKDYFQMLLPEDLETDFGSPNLPPPDAMSMNHLRQLPLGDQVRTLLTNAKVLKFQQLLTLLSTDVDPMAVIRAIQQVAVLVQGCWVVKSEVLYPKDSFSVHTGVPAEVLCRARDYVMWRFTQSVTITRKEVTSLVKLPHDDVKDILEQMARVRPLKGWAFIMPSDEFFMRRHPEVVQRQQMLWDAKYQQLAKTMKLPKAGDASDTQGLKSPSRPRQRRRTKSSQSGETSEEDVKPDIGKSPKRENRLDASSNEQMDVDSDSARSNDINVTVTANGHDQVDETQFQSELRDFLNEKLRAARCSSLSNLKLLLNAKLIDSSPGHVLSRGVSTKIMEVALQQIGAEHINSQWSGGSAQEPIYALPTAGDRHDPQRRVLLDLFRSTARHRKAAIKKKLEEVTGEHLSDKDFLEILKEYCAYSKTGFYMLKGTYCGQRS